VPIGPDPMYNGDPVARRITMGNNGNMVASNVRINGTINGVYAPGATNEYESNSWLNYGLSSLTNVVWTNVSGAVSYGTSFILTGYLNTGIANFPDEICFDATISSTIAENLVGISANNSDISSFNCHQIQAPIPPVDDFAFDLTITSPKMSGDLAYAISGTNLDFSLTVSNTGSAARDGFVRCNLPAANVLYVEPQTGTPVTWSWNQGGLTLEMDDYVTIPNN
jgi:hypothetical protein